MKILWLNLKYLKIEKIMTKRLSKDDINLCYQAFEQIIYKDPDRK